MAIMQATAKAGADVPPQAKPAVRVFVDAGNGVQRTQTLEIPQSHDEMMGLLSQRRVVNEQLENATDHRNDLLEQLNAAPESAKPGFQAQLNVLNDRIVQLETSLNVIGQEIAGASPALMSMAEEPTSPPDQPGTFEDGVAVGVFSTLGGVTVLLLLARWIWKRFARRDVPSPRRLPAEDSERLKRLENSFEAMAIEIERISEGQRFVTRLMSESRSTESAPR
jgi:hypothetical protein